MGIFMRNNEKKDKALAPFRKKGVDGLRIKADELSVRMSVLYMFSDFERCGRMPSAPQRGP